jgi:chemotaxis protein histidine kinase CheA
MWMNISKRRCFGSRGARALAFVTFLLGPAGLLYGQTAGTSKAPPAPDKAMAQQVPVDTTSLSELQRLKAELLQAKIVIAQLRATLADREARLASIELTQEQEKLVEEFRRALNADPMSPFDWTTLTFRPVGQLPVKR